MKWITRERPKIDRIACPWLIKRYIDSDAEFLFVPSKEVLEQSELLRAIPYDIPDVEFTHYDDQCTFDYFVKRYKINDPAVHTIATIVRAADTDRHDLASQASGLWSIFAGLSYNIKDDLELLEIGFVIYDGLYSWAQHLRDQKHTNHPSEQLLVEIYNRFLSQKNASKKEPSWVEDLKAIIQDQIDTNIGLSLEEVSQSLQIHPSYLSREFSKYFNNMNFGEYFRKLRIDKAIQLMKSTDYSLAEIGYLTGFSDQSHFARIFKKLHGIPPGTYRKRLQQ